MAGRSHIYYNSSLSYNFHSIFGSKGYTFPSIQAPVEDVPCQIVPTSEIHSPIYTFKCDELTVPVQSEYALENYKTFFPFSNIEVPPNAIIDTENMTAPPIQYFIARTVIEIKNGYNKKYCLILVLIYFVVLICLFFLLALIFKYRIEKMNFEKKF